MSTSLRTSMVCDNVQNVTLPKIGDRITLKCPKNNRFCSRPELVTKTIIVTRLEDATKVPIDAAEFAADPLVCHGRWRVFGINIDTREFETVYLDWKQPRTLRLAIMVDGDRVSLNELSKPTASSRKSFGRLCQDYILERPGSRLSRFPLVVLACRVPGEIASDFEDDEVIGLVSVDEPAPTHQAARIRRAEAAVITPDLFPVEGRLVACQDVGA